MLRHKASGRAYVVLPSPGGKRNFHYLGEWGSPESQAEYDRVIARLAASPNRNPTAATSDADLTLNELLLGYVRHAEGYYLNADGKPSSVADRIKYAIRLPADLFGSEPATSFGPRCLKTVMDGWVKAGLSRKHVNEQARVVRKAYQWAVGEELIDVTCYERLRRCRARVGVGRPRRTGPRSSRRPTRW